MCVMKKFLFSLMILLSSSIVFADYYYQDFVSYSIDTEKKVAHASGSGPSWDYSWSEVTVEILEKVTYKGVDYPVVSLDISSFYWDAYMMPPTYYSFVIPSSINSISRNFWGVNIDFSISPIKIHVSDIAAWCDIDFDYDPTYNDGNVDFLLIQNDTILTNLVIPDGVDSIKPYAFYNLSQISTVTIPESVTYIALNAFSGTSWLENQKGCVYINDMLYKYCGNMPANTHIDIKEGTVKICEGAFSNCSNLNSITIPSSVTEIGMNAFSACSSLVSINVDENNLKYTSIDGVLYDKNVTTLICCPKAKDYITIADSVITIDDNALENCIKLNSVTIPATVTAMGSNTFYNCSSLDTITCFASIPPSAYNLFSYYNSEIYKKCLLFVPENSLVDYKNHNEWKKFINIQGMKEEYTIKGIVIDEDMGCIDGSGVYKHGVKNTIEAKPNKGYYFVGWDDGITDNPRVITVTHDSTFTAIFALEEFALYATSASPELGYVERIIRAITIEGFEFERWSDGNTDNPRTIVLSRDTCLYAHFKMKSSLSSKDIEFSKISEVNVYVENGELHIDGAKEDFYVLDIMGRLIYVGRQSVLMLPNGEYLVTINGEIEKVLIQ